MIVGLCGYRCVGKDEVANILRERGYKYYSCNDIIKEECEKKGLEKTRENFAAVAEELKEKLGTDVIAKRMLEKINDERKKGIKDFVIDDIESLKEIEELKKDSDFILVGVNAPFELRFERMKAKGELKNVNNLEEFKVIEEKERLENPKAQEINKVYKMADRFVFNDGTTKDLKQRLDYALNNEVRKRPSWDDYFMEICDVVKKRSTCLRRQVGAVLTQNNQIISTGYNGPPKGHPHCYELGGCLRDVLKVPSGQRFELSRAVHAEENAIAQAAENGISTKGAVLYCTTFPCVICMRMIVNAGVKKVVYKEYYPDEMSADIAKKSGVEVVQYTK